MLVICAAVEKRQNVQQEFLGQCGLTGIRVGDNGEGPPPADFLFQTCHSVSSFLWRGDSAGGFGKGEENRAPCGFRLDGDRKAAVFRPSFGTYFLPLFHRGANHKHIFYHISCPITRQTDHICFYERYGWEYLCDAMGEGEDTPSWMYRKSTE